MSESKNNGTKWLIAAIIFAGFNLRAALTGVGSLVSDIQAELNFSATVAGMVTTIPVLAFAAVSPFVGKIGAKLGAGKLMMTSLLVLCIGIISRSYAGLFGFFFGTMLIGGGIAVGNVMLPAIIKSTYPNKAGLFTSIYTSVMGVFAGVASGISVPLAKATGNWRSSLAVWSIMAFVAALIWISQRNLSFGSSNSISGIKLMASARARWVALFLGLQSLLFYAFVAWLPTILQSKGMSAVNAGYCASIYQFISIAGSFVTPILATRRKDQRNLASALALLYFTGIFIFLLAKTQFFMILSVLICGYCTGSHISFAMTLIVLRTDNAQKSAALSGIAQSFGYAVAATGPFIMGAIFDITSSWTIPIIFLLVVISAMFVAGRHAGAEGYV